MAIVETTQTEDRRKATQALAASGLVTGLLASSCCLLPLVLVSVGIGGAWVSQLTALAPYQPLFLGASATALGFGLWRAYRRHADCAQGSLCERPNASRTTKAILWLGVLALLAAMSVNAIVPLIL